MKTKHCTTCDTMKPMDEFHRNKRRKDGRNSWCKACAQKWRDKPETKIRLLNNSRRHRAGEATSIPERLEGVNEGREIKVKLVESLGGACFDCGYTSEYISVFDFHHRDAAEKEYNVAELLWKWQGHISQTLLDEIKKCDLLCSNCHRIRHQKEGYPENTGPKRRDDHISQT